MTDPIKQALEAMRDGLSACQSVSMSRDRRITRDGCVSYLQTEEWCRWLDFEVAPKIRAAIEVLEGLEKAEPVAWRVDAGGYRYAENPHAIDEVGLVITDLSLWTPLYTHPAPVQAEPVAWRYVPSKVWGSYVLTENAEQARQAQEHGISVEPLFTHPAPVQAEPSGWKLVPVEPTNEMTSAMADALDDPDNEKSSWDLAENMYRAMLNAAPQPAAQVVALTDAQVDNMIHTKHFDKSYQLKASDKVVLEWYRLGVRDAEAAHGIKPPEKGGAV